MSNKTLRIELSILEKQFPKDHECFQVVMASNEELTCRFINKDSKYTLNCNISVSLTYTITGICICQSIIDLSMYGPPLPLINEFIISSLSLNSQITP